MIAKVNLVEMLTKSDNREIGAMCSFNGSNVGTVCLSASYSLII